MLVTSLLSKNAFRTVVEVGSYSVISLGTMRLMRYNPQLRNHAVIVGCQVFHDLLARIDGGWTGGPVVTDITHQSSKNPKRRMVKCSSIVENFKPN